MARSRRRHAPPLRARVLGSARVTVLVALAVALAGGGGAYAAYHYDRSAAQRLMPGITIAGVDVGGMSRTQALEAVGQAADERLDRQIEITVAEESWHVTPGELGTTARVKAAVNQALAVSGEFAWPERAFRRLLDRPVSRSFDLEYRYRDKTIGRFVDTIAEAVAVSPTDAQVDFEDGELVLRKPRQGRALRIEEARRSMMDALTGSIPAVELGLRTLKPQVTTRELGHTIVVRLSELTLYLYDGLDLVKTYPVAAGQPAYPTPQGEWTVINKAENPTWINPAPDGWGAGLPLSIAGGPSNPLGTRALYLDAPGIRIHGTADSGSIGSYASHGCVRMFQSDVEELYEIVPIGTTVHVVS